MDENEEGKPESTGPAGKPSAAELARRRLEQLAAEKGVCPDCGYKAEYCACGATSA